MTKNILVTGASGQLGSEFYTLSELPEYKKLFVFYFPDKDALNLFDEIQLEKFCLSRDIHIIINCAAYTRVDKAEDEVDEAYAVNADLVKQLSLLSKKLGISLIHFSTDYVFDGTFFKPYVEQDSCNPQSVYGKSKLAGEKEMLSVNPENSLIIRTSWLYSRFGNNFVLTMLKLAQSKKSVSVVADQFGSPTYASDLARATLQCIPKLQFEGVRVYHYCNQGACSWFEFAQKIFKFASLSCEALAIPSSEYPTAAKRPAYSVLSNEAFTSDFEIEIAHWKDALKTFIDSIELN